MASAHERTVKAILEDGAPIETENGEKTIEYPEPLCVRIHAPHLDPQISPGNPQSRKFLDEYVKSVMSIRPRIGDIHDFSYTYGNRIWDHPTGGVDKDFKPHGDGWGGGIEQVSGVIAKLTRHPTTRRGVIGLWNVAEDRCSDAPPCVDLAQLILRDNRVNLVVYIRSNDMLEAYGGDIYALFQLQNYTATCLANPYHPEITTGYMYTISASAHIYHKRDEDDLNKMRRVIG